MLNFLHGKKIEEAPYKEEPVIKTEEEVKDCPPEILGDIGCPVPPEVE